MHQLIEISSSAASNVVLLTLSTSFSVGVLVVPLVESKRCGVVTLDSITAATRVTQVLGQMGQNPREPSPNINGKAREFRPWGSTIPTKITWKGEIT